MSNYPNMSYCMNENTLLALQQVIQAMTDNEVEFYRNLNRSERRAYSDLYNACMDFMSRADELAELSEEM